MSAGKISFANTGTRVFGSGVVAVFMVATLGGILETATGGKALWPGLLALAVELALLVRALALGVDLTQRDLVIHGWLRTRTIPRAGITGVGIASYSGIYNHGSDSGRYAMLIIGEGDKVIEVQGVAGKSERVWAIVDLLRTELGLPQGLRREGHPHKA